ncbi:unnamed protein product [Gemmata massiliana]|uniref:Uncharacterized protein n=1 Tax=Gemmata massiliana TaxID=1210884 RepID=A0A6P2CX11_9BACT|nr:hypothetical protein [Gemmata massiliana]VTR93443.1 unnamed protein product [Gemmata massiliana]
MVRSIGLVIGLLVSVCAATGDEAEDPIKDKLVAARAAYDAELVQYAELVGEWFDKREDAARKDGNKKLVDQVKVERKVFDKTGELPRDVPAAIPQKKAVARRTLEAAYTQAIKEYTRAKKDDKAEAAEKGLVAFQKEFWKHLDMSKVTVKDDFIRLPSYTDLPTVEKYAGGVEVVVVARTEADNIRLRAQRGAGVIFNWEVNPRELRVCRPDGTDAVESGSQAVVKVTPLKPNTWYTIKWRLTEDGMRLSVDGKTVFEEQRRYELKETAPITVRSEKSTVDVKEFRVTVVEKKR